MLLQPGTKIGRYQVQRKLARGGMGTVYVAQDPMLGRMVAVKVFVGDMDVPDAAERFAREARAAASLNHTNIVTVFDFGEVGSQPYIVMEYIQGDTMAEIIRRRTAVSLAEKVRWLEELCEGVASAHKMGVVHRDIKPGNLMIDRSGRLKILDFGIAKIVNSLAANITAAVIGTPRYMAPEQLLGHPLDARSDIFAIGAVCFELLTYEEAFQGDSFSAITHKVINEDVRRLSDLVPEAPPELCAIVEKSLQKNPADRYEDAESMRVAISRVRRPLEDPGIRDISASTVGDSVRAAGKAQAGALPSEPHDRREGFLERIRRAAKRIISARPAPTHAEVHSSVALDRTMPVPAVAPPSETRALDARDAPPPIANDGTVYIGKSAAADDSRTEARLLIVRSPDARRRGQTIDVSTTPFTLGRADDSRLAMADPGWSREHAVIEFQDGGYAIRDLASANGTYVNGRAVQGVQPLFFGASIRMGDSELHFEYGRDPTLPDLTGIEIADRYVLRRRIRESVKAAMYAASDRHVPREVAMKLLSPRLMGMSGYREQFAREAETASQLQHPHICRVIDSGQASIPMPDGTAVQTHFLCFDLMTGGNLADRLETLSDVGLHEMCQWIETLGSALHHSHERGIIHGDLKPAAVVFDQAGHLYLTDFAIAQRALNARGQHFMGSPAYVAPEQWDNGTITPATDQFAFAVIAYYLIAGSRPYEGLDHPEIRAQQFRRGPEAAHEVAARNHRPPVPRAVSEVLRRGLSTLGSDRYATTEQFARALLKGLSEGRRVGDAPQVFISYDRQQSGGWARLFARELSEKHGVRVFIDTMGLDRAERFPPRLGKAIEECDVFICFLAGSTLTSKWVNEEINLAHAQRKLMIPIFQESYVAPESAAERPELEALMSHQGIMLFDVGGHYIDAAVADLAAMIKGTRA